MEGESSQPPLGGLLAGTDSTPSKITSSGVESDSAARVGSNSLIDNTTMAGQNALRPLEPSVQPRPVSTQHFDSGVGSQLQHSPSPDALPANPPSYHHPPSQSPGTPSISFGKSTSAFSAGYSLTAGGTSGSNTPYDRRGGAPPFASPPSPTPAVVPPPPPAPTGLQEGTKPPSRADEAVSRQPAAADGNLPVRPLPVASHLSLTPSMYTSIGDTITELRASGPPELRQVTSSDVPLAIALNNQSHYHRGLAADLGEMCLFISRLAPTSVEGLLEIFNSTPLPEQTLEALQPIFDNAPLNPFNLLKLATTSPKV